MTTVGTLYETAGRTISRAISHFALKAQQNKSTFSPSASSVRKLVITTSQTLASIYKQIRKGFITFNTQIDDLE